MFFLKKLFTKKKVTFNITAPTIPESLGYSIEKFDLLTNTIVNWVDENNKVTTFVAFVEDKHFQNFGLDLSNPNHALVLGYAFCAAIILRHTINTRTSADEALKAFYSPVNKNVSTSKNN